jgi:hypothetical protein
MNVDDLTEHPAEQLEMNDIASVDFDTTSPLFFDAYERNRATGSFILIDPLSNATVGAAMIRAEIVRQQSGPPSQQPASRGAALHDVTERERRVRYRHFPAVFCVNGKLDVAKRLERSLFERGFVALLVRQSEFPPSALQSVLSALCSAGMVVVYEGELTAQERGVIRVMAEDRLFELAAAESSAMAEEILHQALGTAETLRLEAIFPKEGGFH